MVTYKNERKIHYKLQHTTRNEQHNTHLQIHSCFTYSAHPEIQREYLKITKIKSTFDFSSYPIPLSHFAFTNKIRKNNKEKTALLHPSGSDISVTLRVHLKNKC